MSSPKQLIDALSSVQRNSLSDSDRRALLASARALCLSLETPWESLQRMVWHQPAQLAALKICSDLQLFQKWQAATAEKQTPQQLCELLGKDVCDPALLARLLRLLAVTNLLDNPLPNYYAQTPFTLAFTSSPAFPAALRYFEHIQSHVLHALPTHLACLRYRNPSSADLPCFQFALRSPVPAFQWLAARPDDQRDFGQLMRMYAGMQTPWVDIFPTESLLEGDDGKGPLLVDVGGGIGHDLVHFAKKHPGVAGPRLVLQDNAGVVAQTVVAPEMGTAMAHDFFTPQNVKGASAYFLHSVLHDWTDDDSRKILGHLRDAMVPKRSRLLIHEIVIQEQGGSIDTAASDIVMMATLGAKERSEEAWRSLLSSAGFEIRHIYRTAASGQSVIEAMVVG
ncbi:S-adenosyl-L-methionine-dependent methyltransferase [Trichoderma pleuroticola]